jgi:hypothetical protein
LENYEVENMLDDGSGNKTWLPGFSVATMMKAWNKHRMSAAYKTQLQNLTQVEALDLLRRSRLFGQLPGSIS